MPQSIPRIPWHGYRGPERAEIEENTCRKELLPSEAVAKAMERLPREKEEAKERQREHGNTAPGKQKINHGKFPQVNGTALDKVAKSVGMDRKTLKKAMTVIEAASSPTSPPEVKEAALEMDRTGKVDPAYRKTQEPSEMVEIANELLPQAREEAKERQGRAGMERSEKFSGHKQESLQKIASALGTSAPTLRKAMTVMATCHRSQLVYII